MQQNLMLTDQGDIVLRCIGHLVREQEEKEDSEESGARTG